MDNAEQSPRGPSKGIFDTASLLGIHSSHQASCKTSTASSSLNLATASQKSSSKIKSNASVIGEVNSGKPSEKSKTTLNNVQTLLSVNSSISGNIVSKSSSKKNSIENSESGTEVSSLSQQNSTSRSKKHINDSSSKNVSSKNGKNKGNSKSKAQANSKPKEKTAKRFSSDSESHSDSSCTSTGSDSGSSGGVSSSASSESSDDEEREKQQKQLAKLKKQQMELRRKVQELKQASQESTHPKADIHVKRTPSKCSGTPSNSSKATKPVPTPAHSASATSVSPSAASPKSSKTMLSSPGEEDVNMSVPLDLCIKKQEPTFEVANTSVNNSYTSPTSIVKKQVPTSSIQSPSMKLQAGVKKRGRKPKFALSSSNNIMDADAKSHNLKQNPVKELGGLQIISLSSDSAAISDITIHHKKTANSIVTASKPVSLLAARVADSVSTPRKNFTLDSLLSESNGTIDVISSQVDNDMEMLPSSSFSSKVSKNKERLRYSSRIKKMEAKNKEIETKIRRETSSGTDSDVENDNSDTDDTEKSASGSIISNVPTSTSGHGHKRSYDEDGDDSPTKRKRILPDEKDIQIPLEHGWRRQTKIRCFSRSGVRGEVTYYAPCGKKLRNYPEVVRYLIKHGITDITRENFSFSTKINVGEFLESTSSGAGEDYVLLSEQEVIARIDEVRARKGRLGVQVRKTPQQRSAEEEEQQRQWEQKQLQHQLEQQAEEARRQKEHQRLLKQQERFERLEQLRIEREIRAQQLIEEQEMKRQQAVFLREQEMQKRREMLLMVDLERERRRQHMMLVRALEARKKQEERERKREEILYEKRLNKEKKMEQRRMELDYLRELKKPVEDMTLKDTTPLPTLNRIPGVKLSGKAFADTLMVFEFLHNFGETLGFDMESLPSLNTMQMALLNLEEKCEEELLSVIHHLLVCVIEDPGVPNCPEATTVLGQSLKDADITNNNVSEILRLYFIAQDKGSKLCQCLQEKPFLSLSPSQKAEILSYLCNELLCSRLLVRQIDNNIETVNTLRKDKWIVEGDLRKLKTIQQRRALKLKQTANEENKLEQPPGDNTISEVSDSGVTNDFSKENQPSEKGEDDCGEKDSSNKSEKEKFEELENDVANESGNESDDTQATGQVSDGEDEEPHLSNEELSKKIDKLTKQLNSFSAKLVRACHTLRGVTFGQDRYHRRYWVLPKSGGIFVEGMESSELPQEQEKIFLVSPDEQPCDIEKETKNSTLLNADVEKPPVKQESENRGDEIEMQKCIQDEQKQPDNLKSEIVDTQIPLSKETAEVKEKEQSDSVEKKSESEKEVSEKTNEKKTEGKPNVNIFMPKFCDNSIREEANTPTNSTGHNTDKKQSTNPSIPGDQNWLLHSPFFASLLAGNMLFNGPMMPGREVNGTYFNLPKNDSNNPFGPFLGLPSGMLSAEQIFKSLGEKQSNQKPWFSILPRMPCDENSLIHTQLSKSSITSSAHSPGNLGMPNTPSPSKSTSHTSHSTPVSASSGHMAAALANLQMELLNGLPPGFFLHPYLPHQFGPTYQNGPPATNSSHQSSFTSTLSHTSPSTDFNLNLSHPPASSTPSSIPTPSATPGPTSQGSATPSLRDSPSPSFAKRLVIDRMSQEHERPKPVPLELRKGWWRITDSGQLKTLLSALHHRGIREKMLQKQIQKHFNYACTACSQGQQDATDLDITDLDRQISQLPGGAPVAEGEAWSREVALRVDLAILEQVENLEEKVGGASMQVKGWKPPLKMSSDSTVAFFPACEQYLQEKNCSKTKQLQNSIQSIALNNKNLVDEKCKSTSQSKVNNSINTTVETVELDNKDRSIKCEKSTSDISDDTEDIKDDVCEKDESMDLEQEDLCESEVSGNINPVEEAKKRLLMVEAAIERRYLRPPLGTSTNELNLSTMSNSGTNNNQTISEAGDEVHVPVGLLKWRDAVKACKTSSQLAMCLNFLESCTAWDKSIMRASCQFCHSGDNEDMLLLCDGCDKGYHTYCFKPKMEAIPEGDWYCYECLNKATGDKVCVICGKKGKLLECETCPKTFHLTCLEPPLSKMPKGKWYCSGCSHNKPKKSSKKNSNSKDKDNSKEQKDSSGSNKKSENSQSSKSKSAEKKEKKDRNQVNKDLAPCSSMVDELEKHDDAWPFLMPVNTKQFPTYRKVIKKPMDFNTIRSKLESGLYKSREDFVGDVRLIFDNCETFNEDDSPVGQAGHTLRAFFETRWSELCAT